MATEAMMIGGCRWRVEGHKYGRRGKHVGGDGSRGIEGGAKKEAKEAGTYNEKNNSYKTRESKLKNLTRGSHKLRQHEVMKDEANK